jgi:hypothetical protein
MARGTSSNILKDVQYKERAKNAFGNPIWDGDKEQCDERSGSGMQIKKIKNFDFAYKYREKSEELAMAMGKAWPVAAKIALAPLAMSVAWTVAHSKKSSHRSWPTA